MYCFILCLGSTVGAFLGGYLIDMDSSYRSFFLMLVIAGGISIFAALMIIRIDYKTGKRLEKLQKTE